MQAPPAAVTTVLAVGPADAIALLRVVAHALDRGLRVVLASDRHSSQSIEHPALVRVDLPPILHTPLGSGVDGARAWAIRTLRATVRAWRPDVVHVHGLGPYAELCRLARVRPLVVSSWGFLNDLLAEAPTPLPAETHRVLADCAAVIVESTGLERAVGEVVSPPTQVEVLPLGVDGGLFAPSDRARARWRRALDIPADGFVVISPRGWAPNYNQAVVFQAFREAQAALSRPMFLIFLRIAREVAEGASADAMRAMEDTIEAAGLNAAVRWLPALRHPMMAGLFSATDLLVSVPSSDAMPSTLIEAAACEVPFVVSDLPHYRGTFIERGGTRVDPTDHTALASALVRHARREILPDRAALRAEVCACYEQDSCARQLIAIYARHLSAPERRRPAVSVIIAAHERPHLLVRGLDSALAQTVVDREVIVVVDGSSSETRRALAPYEGRITVVRTAKGGLASARNAGLRVARGHFVAFLDDDALWVPDQLSALLPLIESDDTVDLVYADMPSINADGAPPGRRTCFGNAVPRGAVLVRYTAIAEGGFFDETPRTAEDGDLWLRFGELAPPPGVGRSVEGASWRAPAAAMKGRILDMVRRSAQEKPYGWLNYQPIDLPGYEETIALRGRDCYDRSRAIFVYLARELGEGPLSIEDWGSNLGFFVFEAAKHGHRARGYDVDARLVEACQYLASSNDFSYPPSFELRELSAEAVRAGPRCDVVLCFSVLHHLKTRAATAAMEAIAEHCRVAILELDGENYGRAALERFFWRVDLIVETNDRYGSGRRRRRTWFCTNHEADLTFQNLKRMDLALYRGVFSCTRPSGLRTVFKRESVGAPYRHTWLDTGLAHEREIYESYPSPFFPALLGAGEAEFRWIEIEYIEARGGASPEAVDALYDYLEEAGLFVLDFKTDGFIPCDGAIRMIDLESVFPVEGSVAETLARHLLDPARDASAYFDHDTYAKQRASLKRAFCR